MKIDYLSKEKNKLLSKQVRFLVLNLNIINGVNERFFNSENQVENSDEIINYLLKNNLVKKEDCKDKKLDANMLRVGRILGEYTDKDEMTTARQLNNILYNLINETFKSVDLFTYLAFLPNSQYNGDYSWVIKNKDLSWFSDKLKAMKGVERFFYDKSLVSLDEIIHDIDRGDVHGDIILSNGAFYPEDEDEGGYEESVKVDDMVELMLSDSFKDYLSKNKEDLKNEKSSDIVKYYLEEIKAEAIPQKEFDTLHQMALGTLSSEMVADSVFLHYEVIKDLKVG